MAHTKNTFPLTETEIVTHEQKWSHSENLRNIGRLPSAFKWFLSCKNPEALFSFFRHDIMFNNFFCFSDNIYETMEVYDSILPK